MQAEWDHPNWKKKRAAIVKTNQSSKRAGCKRGIQRYIVNPSVQWRYTATAVIGVFVISAFVSILLYGVLFDQARSRTLHGATTSVSDTTVTILTAAIAFAAVPAIACGLWAIVMTHRLCGPIRVLESHLRELASGRFPKHRPLRKRDSFRDVYEVFWQVVDTFKTSRSKHIEELGRLRNSARRAINGTEDAGRALESIASRLDEICQERNTLLGINEPNADDICPAPLSTPAPSPGEFAESTT